TGPASWSGFPEAITASNRCGRPRGMSASGVVVWRMERTGKRPGAKRAGRCWGLCRHRHLLHLNIHVRIPALEDGTQLPIERLHARLQQQMRTGFGPLHLLFFTESLAHYFVHCRLHKSRRDRLAVAIPFSIIRDQGPVMEGGWA